MRSRPSVLLISTFPSGASARKAVCQELSDRLCACGWTTFKASSKASRIPRLLHMLTTCLRYRNRYQVAHVDVYSGAAFLWAEAVCMALRFIQKPYLLTLHGGNLPAFSGCWPRRVSALLRSAAVVTAPSRYLFEEMSSYRDDIVMLPNALDLENFAFRLRSQVRPELIWVRSFQQVYNPQLAVDVVARLRPAFPDIHLSMIGPDKGDGSLDATRELAARHDVLDHITFAGLVPKQQIHQWLEQADIFLNTTNVDNTPVSVIEAMACGLCVVSTNVGGIPYLITHGEDGLLVRPRDPELIASAISEILMREELATRLSLGARRTAEQFDWTAILPQWLALLGAFQESAVAVA